MTGIFQGMGWFSWIIFGVLAVWLFNTLTAKTA